MLRKFIRMLLPYRPIRVTSSFWEKQYKTGRWDRIREIDELAHYSIIIGYTHFLKRGGRILDVGCGEGILCERLCQNYYSRYLGIDISTEAIARASSRNDDKNEFLVARIEDFEIEEKFDVIIFNECLYYMEEPGSTLQHYQSFLAKNGQFIVSMNNTSESLKIWKRLDKLYSIKDAVSVSNSIGESWTIKVLGVEER